MGERDPDSGEQQRSTDDGPRGEHTARCSVEDAAAKVQGGERLAQTKGRRGLQLRQTDPVQQDSL